MTIYDQDYLAELNQQEAHEKEWAQPGVEDPVAVDQVEVQQEESVPEEGAKVEEFVSDKEMNFKALREELAYIKEDRDRLRQEFDRYNQEKNAQREPEPPRKRYMDEIPDDDLVTGAQLKRSWAEKEAEYQQKLQDQELYLQELRVKNQNPDYDEVTAKYGLPLLEKEPDLAQGFLASNNKAAYLYKIGKMAMAADRESAPVQQAPRVSQNAQKMVQNASRPGTLSNPVGGSAQLSQAEYFATMSDAEFSRLVNKNLEGI